MWCLITMNRPDRCQKTLNSMISAEVSTPGAVIVNGPQRIDEYRRLRLPQSWVMIELPENIGICGGLNHAFRRFPNEPWYGLVCDDELVFTPGFDKTLVGAAGRWGIAHGNDNWRASYRLWTYVVYPGDLLRTVGYWAPPGLWHWYFDDHWETISNEFGLKRFCQDIRTEHEHTDNGKVSLDETYAVGRSRAGYDRDRFERWKMEEWPIVRDRIKAAMESKVEPPKPKGDWLTCANRGEPTGLELNCGCNIDKTIYQCSAKGRCLKRLPPGRDRFQFGSLMHGVTECYGECNDAV